MAAKIAPPDKELAKDQLAALQQMYREKGAELFCIWAIWILHRKTGLLIPFKWNRIQRDLQAKLGKNNRTVKPRQAGYTTWFLLARLFVPILLDRGQGGLLISQSGEYAEDHFRIAHRAYEHFAEVDPYSGDPNVNKLSRSFKANLLHVKYSNRRELYFDILDSKLRIESAEIEEAGQGLTLHHVVASEAARWPGNPEATLSNIRGSLAPGGTLDEESTANGAMGFYFGQCMRCLNDPTHADATLHYHSWFWDDLNSKDISETEKDKLITELTNEELLLIQQMQHELHEVAWEPGTVMVPGV